MKLMSTLLLASWASVFVLSCSKNNNNNSTTQNPCKINKAYILDSTGNPADSATYTYTGNSVTKIQWTHFYETLDYSGSNITKRSFYANTGSVPETYDQISYNTDGSVNQIQQFINAGGTGDETRLIQFTYASNKVSKVTINTVTNGTVNPNGQVYTYSWTANNITTINYTDSSGNSQPSNYTANISYDNNANYFARQSSQAWLTDPSMITFSGYLLPLFISTNNPTQVQVFIQSATVIYTLDDHQNVTQITIGGKPLERYTYNCQ